MKTLEDYMNDPSVANIPMPVREVKAIRLMIHDETKNMSSEQLNNYYNQVKQRAQKEFGMKFVSSAK